jgi:hypothetical protein
MTTEKAVLTGERRSAGNKAHPIIHPREAID